MKLNTIVLIDDKGRHQSNAAADFTWDEYPSIVISGNKVYNYIGCVDGVPHYRKNDGTQVSQ